MREEQKEKERKTIGLEERVRDRKRGGLGGRDREICFCRSVNCTV